ncbi:hypothetical protein BST61_g707 [Cercospora zeina]
MWSEQGVRVDLRSMANDSTMREYTNPHFRVPGGVTTSRSVSGVPGEAVQVCLQFDPEFKQYTANALKLEVVCRSDGDGDEMVSQCYAIPLSNKHCGFQVTLDKWVRWHHSQTSQECGRTETTYTLPGQISMEEIPRASDEWTDSYGVANKGSIVINMIRGKLRLSEATRACGNRSSLVPAMPPDDVVEIQPFAIDEAWIQPLNSENCPVLFAEFMNVEMSDNLQEAIMGDSTAHEAEDSLNGFFTDEDDNTASDTDDEGPWADQITVPDGAILSSAAGLRGSQECEAYDG